MIKAVAIVGPTASGKTGTAIATAQQFNGEIVGADSIQVYRGFDIGSAKPAPAERAAIPHHLIDVADPAHDFTAAEYAELAAAAIEDIHVRGKLPLLAGGTGLYLRALLEGLMPAPGGDPGVRDRLGELPTAELRTKLTALDPAWSARILGDDRLRLIRALEIFEVSGKTPSQWAAEQRRDPKYDVLWIGLTPERPELYRKIDQRVVQMWNQGWADEVRGLIAQGYADTRPMHSVGYAEVYRHVVDGVSAAETVAQIQQRTRRYAKRQLTWFRANRAVHWFDSSQTGTVDRIRVLISRWF